MLVRLLLDYLLPALDSSEKERQQSASDVTLNLTDLQYIKPCMLSDTIALKALYD